MLDIVRRLNKLLDSFGGESSLWVIDCSVDFRTSKTLLKHECWKYSIVMSLKKKLKGYVGFSSGAAQFLPNEISDKTYLTYARLKRKTEKYLRRADMHVYYPQIFTVIGPVAYCRKTTGWVEIIDAGYSRGCIELTSLDQRRSWVSETDLCQTLAKFLKSSALADYPPRIKQFDPLVAGDFTNQDLLDILESKLKVKPIAQTTSRKSWLNKEYRNQLNASETPEYEITNLAVAIAASVSEFK